MTVAEFDSGYHYANELRSFAREIGIVVGNRRKIELEGLIRRFLTTGEVPTSRPTLARAPGGPRDTLRPDGHVINYVGDRRTKDFLLECVRAQSPGLPDKSGQWYWLNDWRRAQQEAGRSFTYADLADRLSELMHTDGRLPQIPSARMNNFITDFRADPANAGSSRDEVMAAWNRLKNQPGPKTYAEYRRRKDDNQQA